MSSYDKLKKWKKFDKKKSLDHSIAEMIALDNLPFDHEKDTGLQRLMEKASPQCFKTNSYRDLICEEIYSSVEDKITPIVSSLAQTFKISFTTDEGSDTTSGVPFLSLTCHAINDDFQRQHFVPSSQPPSVFKETLNKWNISLNLAHCVVRDSATNTKRTLNLAEAKNVNCYAQQIQLVVKYVIISERCVSELLTKCRLIAVHSSHSVAVQNDLKPKKYNRG